ncbi:hypothetical protein [Bradyrhizobium neotropicale]|uniref:hypothetical protein n=1 Tax=Bradyrhizobium neotropicale TaxID=1497615 RepID=UPI001FEFCD1B|nr:hypothetical protein [Bradyrhizobium neotropicale]
MKARRCSTTHFHLRMVPAFALIGDDVEEFVGVVRRYGADAAGVRAPVEAGSANPTVAAAAIGPFAEAASGEWRRPRNKSYIDFL